MWTLCNVHSYEMCKNIDHPVLKHNLKWKQDHSHSIVIYTIKEYDFKPRHCVIPHNVSIEWSRSKIALQYSPLFPDLWMWMLQHTVPPIQFVVDMAVALSYRRVMALNCNNVDESRWWWLLSNIQHIFAFLKSWSLQMLVMHEKQCKFISSGNCYYIISSNADILHAVRHQQHVVLAHSYVNVSVCYVYFIYRRYSALPFDFYHYIEHLCFSNVDSHCNTS